MSPVQPVLLFFLLTVAELHRCFTPVTTSVTGADELLLGCLTCSLSKSMVIAPVLQLGVTGASGVT